MALVTVAYLSGPAFDLQYYLDKHMSLAMQHWEPLGMQGYEVVQMEPGQKYQVLAILKWDKVSSWDAMVANEKAASAVAADIPNFTTAETDILRGSTLTQKSII